jgi:ABC-type antimicrobial peptide transport system permease subunit
MAMIVNERKKYMVMLSRIGFRKINIAHIITGEMIWIGLIGSLLGLFGCFISKFVFESLIEHRLAESGLYKYISLGVTPTMVFATLAICVVLCYIIGMVTSILTLKKQNN